MLIHNILIRSVCGGGGVLLLPQRPEPPIGDTGLRATLEPILEGPLGFGRASAVGAVSDELKAFRGRGSNSLGDPRGGARGGHGGCRL